MTDRSAPGLLRSLRPTLRAALLLAALLLPFCQGLAQTNHIRTDRIHSLRVLQDGQVVTHPCLELGTGGHLSISFDDLTKEYHRYIYRVEHCDFDWQPSTRIFDTDYLVGTQTECPIDDYHESLNTTVDYTHYWFDFPNSRIGVKLSGNYQIHIIDDDSGDEVASVCFRVVEPAVGISANVVTNTDIDFNSAHQQLRVAVSPQPLSPRDPQREIRLVAIQNGRYDIAAVNPAPDYYTPSDIRWEHSQQLIFPAGNEFRKFEMTNLRTGLIGVESIKWFAPYYHATLFTTEPRHNYVYDQDQDGRYYINSTERTDDDYEADYLLVHFSLQAPPQTNGHYYIYGGLSNWNYVPSYRLAYNAQSQLYEGTALLKEGYYNYLYLFRPDGVASGQTEPAEGNHYQAENEYTLLVYYTPIGGRYDRLVGMKTFTFSPQH